jgi:DNA-damage-inducible protein J
MYLKPRVEENEMPATTMVHVRLDRELKDQAAETLEGMGLSVSDAIRIFLKRVVADREFPFALKVPNATTLAAFEEADEIIKQERARFESAEDLINDLEEKARE